MSKHVIICMCVYISHDKVAKFDKLIMLWETIVCLQRNISATTNSYSKSYDIHEAFLFIFVGFLTHQRY